MRTLYLWGIVLGLLIGSLASVPRCEEGDRDCNKFPRSWYIRKDALFQECLKRHPNHTKYCDLQAERRATRELQKRKGIERMQSEERHEDDNDDDDADNNNSVCKLVFEPNIRRLGNHPIRMPPKE